VLHKVATSSQSCWLPAYRLLLTTQTKCGVDLQEEICTCLLWGCCQTQLAQHIPVAMLPSLVSLTRYLRFKSRHSENTKRKPGTSTLKFVTEFRGSETRQANQRVPWSQPIDFPLAVGTPSFRAFSTLLVVAPSFTEWYRS